MTTYDHLRLIVAPQAGGAAGGAAGPYLPCVLHYCLSLRSSPHPYRILTTSSPQAELDAARRAQAAAARDAQAALRRQEAQVRAAAEESLYLSPMSPLYLPCICPISPLYLAPGARGGGGGERGPSGAPRYRGDIGEI